MADKLCWWSKDNNIMFKLGRLCHQFKLSCVTKHLEKSEAIILCFSLYLLIHGDKEMFSVPACFFPSLKSKNYLDKQPVFTL